MITFPIAKINLGLRIIEKRPDGFHSLQSCFYPVGWSDVLEVVSAPSFGFSSSGIPIPGAPETNLCIRAYKLLASDFNLPPVQLHLHKLVPIGAGLGGGSADAAFTLSLLNEQFNLALDATTLENYARQLGSDCAFFIQNRPRYCLEKGDVFEDITIDLGGYHLLWKVKMQFGRYEPNPPFHVPYAFTGFATPMAKHAHIIGVGLRMVAVEQAQ